MALEPMTRFECPECGGIFKSNRDIRGRSIECPDCKQRTAIPPESVFVPAIKDSAISLSDSSPSRPTAVSVWGKDPIFNTATVIIGGFFALVLVVGVLPAALGYRGAPFLLVPVVFIGISALAGAFFWHATIDVLKGIFAFASVISTIAAFSPYATSEASQTGAICAILSIVGLAIIKAVDVSATRIVASLNRTADLLESRIKDPKIEGEA